MTKIANRDNWLDYLRSFITMLVVAHHSSLAYTTFAHFNKDAYILSTHPIVDPRRWKGLDLFEDFNDIFFMSLMFLISGIFIIRSLENKGVQRFIRDRWRRLFIPFIIGVTVLMPIAYYPAWLLAHGGDGPPGVSGLRAYLVDFFTVEAWPVGPPWFIWVLFLFNVVFAAVYPFIKKSVHKLSAFISLQKQHPIMICVAWLVVTWIAYIPFVLWLGPDSWTGWGPFDFQKSRLCLYFCYFLLGVLIGAPGLNNGILSGESIFIRTASFWLAGCLSIYVLLKLSEAPLTEAVTRHQLSAWSARLIYRSIWVLSCTFSCIAALTIFKEWAGRSRSWWESLSANAYGIYLTHYIFVVWCQYELLNYHWPAVIKFLITLGVSLVLSWLLTEWVRRNAFVRKYL
ncbi:MAG TPA: acyltransferase [Puia sp.]|nr:acyltransferase [Puia sp.]